MDELTMKDMIDIVAQNTDTSDDIVIEDEPTNDKVDTFVKEVSIDKECSNMSDIPVMDTDLSDEGKQFKEWMNLF